MSHEVFIERCQDTKPATATQLAQAIATRYGVASDQISTRLSKGRFRVKANLDLAAAKVFMTFLEENGALCTIAKNNVVVLRSVGLGTSPKSSTDAVTQDQVALETPVPPPDRPRAVDDPEIVMLDQFTHDRPSAPVVDSNPAFDSMQLVTLDGNQDSIAGAGGSSGEHGASDFLPPEAASDAIILDIDRPEPKPAKERNEARSSAIQEIAELRDQAASEKSTPTSNEPLPTRILAYLAENSRHRFAIGVSLAVLLGFIITSSIASGRESNRYEEPIAELAADYADADSYMAWEALDEARSDTIAELKTRRSTIVLTSLLIWLAVAAIFSYVWMRRIQWDRWKLSA